MRRPIHPRQVRAARALLALSQEELAAEAAIGLATIKRFESGKATRGEIERSLRAALERRGVVIIEATTLVAGVEVGAGVAVRAKVFANSLAGESAGPASDTPRRTRSI